MKTMRAVLAVMTFVALLPPVASASKVRIARVPIGATEAPAVVVDGLSGTAPGGAFTSTNRIVIDDDPSCQQFPTSCNRFTVRDLGSSLLAEGPHCTQVNLNTASCSGGGIGDTRRYSVQLYDGNDQLTVNSAYLSAGGLIQGGTGDDAFALPRRAADFISGGGGRDSLSYLGRTAGGGIKVDTVDGGVFNDGQSNEDRVTTDIEQVTGTNFDDVIFVPNQQASGRSPHGLLSGANGNDNLLGSPFADTLNGGANLDTLQGGAGDDLLEARESSSAGQTVARDDLRCGGGLDTAVMDLQDVQVDCENRSIAAIDEGGTLRILNRRLRRRDGKVTVRLRCPKTSKTRCKGRLKVKRKARTLGSTRYSVRRGRRKRMRLEVAGRKGRVTVIARERDSKNRPKTAVKLLRLRGS